MRKCKKKQGSKDRKVRSSTLTLFRHGHLSELGHDLTDSEMKHIGGWTDRRMISLYSREYRINNKLLYLQGLRTEEEKRFSALQAQPCPKCRTLNGPNQPLL